MLKSEEEVIASYNKYKTELKIIANAYLNSLEDANDAVQNTYVKYMLKSPKFDDDGYEKKWLIRVLVNECRSMKRLWWSRNVNTSTRFDDDEIDDIENKVSEDNITVESERKIILKEISMLPDKYKKTLILSCRGYKTAEIAEILKINVGAVKVRLGRARKMLQDRLELGGGDINVEQSNA